MIEASCHCGAVRLEIAEPPETITDCNCSICSRIGALWAYYHPDQVTLHAAEGALESYARGDGPFDEPGAKPILAFWRCATCGCVTHWRGFDLSHPRMGVNARMMPPEVQAAARVRHLDGAVTWRYLNEHDAPSTDT